MLPLTACGTTTNGLLPIPELNFLKPEIPSELLECPENPEVPPKGSTQSDIAVWILKDEEADEICRRNLKGLREVLSK